MRKIRPIIFCAFLMPLVSISVAHGAESDAGKSAEPTYPQLRVLKPADVKPGVYGRVVFEGAAPPVLNPEPVIIVRQVRAKPVSPIFLHVPPAHASDWAKRCRKYEVCNVPVYFVKSAEYELKAAAEKKVAK
ncbi:MAG: hypothetical protein ABL931_07910 [Usitatibacteraceae bacterium]